MKEEKPKTKPFKILDDIFEDAKNIVRKFGDDIESIGKGLRVKKDEEEEFK